MFRCSISECRIPARCRISETVTLDEYGPQNGGNVQNTHMFVRAGTTPLSPVLGSGMIYRKVIQPVCVTPKAKTLVEGETGNEDHNQSYFSPTIFELFGQSE